MRRPAWLDRAPGVLAALVFVGVVAASAVLSRPPAPLQGGEVPQALPWAELRPTQADAARWDAAELARLDDADPRAVRLLQAMREAGDAAAVVPALEGREVTLVGYVVPLDRGSGGGFLLVPYFGACIHSPPPPANQVVHVSRPQAPALRTMDRVVVRGVLRLARSDFALGASGYAIDGARVEVR